jgi:hypothetical protein
LTITRCGILVIREEEEEEVLGEIREEEIPDNIAAWNT